MPAQDQSPSDGKSGENSSDNDTAVVEEKKICMSDVSAIMDSFPSRSKRYLIPLLTKIQNKYRFLPDEIVKYLIEELKVSRADIYSVISFYPQFRTTEPGKYIFKLCYGTACFVKGAQVIATKIKEKYDIGKGETDATKLYTLEFASCLGNCGAAPMAIIGEDTHGSIDPENTLGIMGEYKLDE